MGAEAVLGGFGTLQEASEDFRRASEPLERCYIGFSGVSVSEGFRCITWGPRRISEAFQEVKRIFAGTETFSGVLEGLRFVTGGPTEILDVLDNLETP